MFGDEDEAFVDAFLGRTYLNENLQLALGR